MEAIQNNNLQNKSSIHFGHLGLILAVAVLLVGVTWMKNPGVFSGKGIRSAEAEVSDLPKYVAYTPPAELSQPMVAGASTENSGPMVINEDGSLSPVLSSGEVLGALIGDTELDLNTITVKEIPDSQEAIKNYFKQAANIESSYIDNSAFESALVSGDQTKIGIEGEKLKAIQNNLLALSVPKSLVKLQKLKIAQYAAAVNILNNFTNADQNPEMVGQYLSQFLKAQQDLDSENNSVMQKFGINYLDITGEE